MALPDWQQERLENTIRRVLEVGNVGIGRAITGRDLTRWLNENGFPDLDQRQMRIAIRTMRRQGILICAAAGSGYYWPKNLADVEMCVRVEFDAKAKDMLITGKAMMDGAIAYFGAQRKLPL